MEQEKSTAHQEAILLIAHGSRRQQANDDLIHLCGMIGNRCPEQIVEHAFLELTKPTIPEGAASCIRRGAKRIMMFPYFLSAGVHVAEDLHRFKSEFEQKWPDATFIICQPLGGHRLIVDIVLDRIGQGKLEGGWECECE